MQSKSTSSHNMAMKYYQKFDIAPLQCDKNVYIYIALHYVVQVLYQVMIFCSSCAREPLCRTDLMKNKRQISEPTYFCRIYFLLWHQLIV